MLEARFFPSCFPFASSCLLLVGQKLSKSESFLISFRFSMYTPIFPAPACLSAEAPSSLGAFCFIAISSMAGDVSSLGCPTSFHRPRLVKYFWKCIARGTFIHPSRSAIGNEPPKSVMFHLARASTSGCLVSLGKIRALGATQSLHTRRWMSFHSIPG